MQTVTLGQALNGGDLFLRNIADVGNARSTRFAVDQNRAGTALAFAAAIFASRQIEVISQNHQEAGVSVCFDGIRVSVDVELSSCRHPKNLSVRGLRFASIKQKLIRLRLGSGPP